MTIHPTALVSDQARIADGVEIGPHAIIGPEVSLGKGCVVDGMAVIEGKTTIGENSSIGYGAVLGAPPQDFAFKDEVRSELRIGKRNTFREYVTIHRGSKDSSATVLGDDCTLMAGSHLGHNVVLGNKVIVGNNCLLAGYVEIGDGVVLETSSVFRQFVRVGSLAKVRTGTRMIKDTPPYLLAFGNSMVSGTNDYGLRTAGWPDEALLEIRRAFALVYGSGLNVSQALQKAKEASWSPASSAFFDFITSSKRGVCRGYHAEKSAL